MRFPFSRTVKVYRKNRDSYSVLKRRFCNIEQQLIESNRKIAEANKIVEKWCKECLTDNFDDCQNDCGIHDLKKCFSQEQKANP
jgi:hypothetical protein